MDFGIGLSIGELGKGGLRGQVAGWKTQAMAMEGELAEVEMVAHARTVELNAALELIQELKEEIQESNPGSPLSNTSFLRQRLSELARQKAFDDGFDFDDGRLIPRAG
ncbi:hypothetical protein AADX40_15050 [Aeromonas veronii]|uniref:hypothetical protein n=1 Tax=Aeromonas veronii TaxID=654 RepID=UPI0031598BBE